MTASLLVCRTSLNKNQKYNKENLRLSTAAKQTIFILTLKFDKTYQHSMSYNT